MDYSISFLPLLEFGLVFAFGYYGCDKLSVFFITKKENFCTSEKCHLNNIYVYNATVRYCKYCSYRCVNCKVLSCILVRLNFHIVLPGHIFNGAFNVQFENTSCLVIIKPNLCKFT